VDRTAALYARALRERALQAAPGLESLAGDAFAVPLPRSGERFLRALRQALSRDLPPETVRRLLPSVWMGAEPPIRHCRSCAASLNEVINQGASDQYCCACSDENGRLRPRAEVRDVLARWMTFWQGPMPPEEASRRADLLMRAMPAWSEN